MLGLVDDPVAKDLQERQSELIKARWIGFAPSEHESSFRMFRDGFTSGNLFNWQ